MASLIDELNRDKEAIIAIANNHNAVNIRLFGSVVRGEEHDKSDVDFLVDFRPGSTLLDQVALISALSTKLGRNVDVVSARALNRHLQQRILDESVSL